MPFALVAASRSLRLALTLLFSSFYSAASAFALRSMPQLRSKNPPRADTRESSHNPSASPTLRVGPAGWSYPDWTGYVYPSRRPKNFHEAAYLAEFFDTIEINTSFYQPLRPEHAELWLN